MTISAEVSFWIGVIGTLFGIIGTGIAIYQCATINESKKKRKEIQFVLAGVGNLALSKVQAWNNQMSLLPTPKEETKLDILRIHQHARDDLAEIYSLASALEGTIDSECSAMSDLLKKSIEQIELNNKLQAMGLPNQKPPINLPKQNSNTQSDEK